LSLFFFDFIYKKLSSLELITLISRCYYYLLSSGNVSACCNHILLGMGFGRQKVVLGVHPPGTP
jgi:hypothetical protein